MTRTTLCIVLAACALVLAACDNPVATTTDHLEAVEVIVRDAAGAELARTSENEQWTGPAAAGLAVDAGARLDLRVSFATLGGREVRLGEQPGLTLRVEWEVDGFAVHEPLDERDRLHGLRPGATSLRFLAWHGTHADFVSPPLPITIHAASP